MSSVSWIFNKKKSGTRRASINNILQHFSRLRKSRSQIIQNKSHDSSRPYFSGMVSATAPRPTSRHSCCPSASASLHIRSPSFYRMRDTFDYDSPLINLFYFLATHRLSFCIILLVWGLFMPASVIHGIHCYVDSSRGKKRL